MRLRHLITVVIISVLGLAAGVGLSACAGSQAQHLSPSAFAEEVKQEGTIILDVRTPEEFASGHLPGAVNIDVEGPDFDQRIAILDKSAYYAVYCHSGRRSAVALDRMHAAGFDHLVDLAGGIIAWTAAGGPLTTD